jgi:hypothetical protein
MLPEDRHELKMFIETAKEGSSSDLASVEVIGTEHWVSH